MFKQSTVCRGLYMAIAFLLSAQGAWAEPALLQVTALQKNKVESLIHSRFGESVREITYTTFSYDQAGWEVFENILPGVTVHGVTFLMKNGTPVHCAWGDSAKTRIIVLKRCELKLNAKISY